MTEAELRELMNEWKVSAARSTEDIAETVLALLDAKAQAERERDTFALCLDDDYLKTERAQLKADLIAERTAHAQTRAVMREHAATCRRDRLDERLRPAVAEPCREIKKEPVHYRLAA